MVGESSFSATIPLCSESLSHIDTETHLRLLREEGDNVAAPAAAPAFRAKRVLLCCDVEVVKSCFGYDHENCECFKETLVLL